MTTNLLGIDYGTKHVGFALGNTLTKSSENFFSFSYSKKNQLEQKILEICKEWEISQMILGMPFNPDGSKKDMCRQIEKFSKSLGKMLLLNLCGGEPWLRKDLPDIARIFVKNNKSIWSINVILYIAKSRFIYL